MHEREKKENGKLATHFKKKRGKKEKNEIPASPVDVLLIPVFIDTVENTNRVINLIAIN